MAGLKLRAQDDMITIAMMEALGFRHPMNYAEVYSALERAWWIGRRMTLHLITHPDTMKLPYYWLDMHTAPSLSW